MTEGTRAVWTRLWLERVREDLRFAARLLRRYPAFSAVTLTVLALGIGATTAMFSIVNSVLLRPLPFREPDRLVMLEKTWLPRFPRFEASPLDFLSWKEECQSYSDIAAFRFLFFNLSEGDLPERIAGMRVTANLPDLLGVSPILGRSFRADEDAPGRNQVVLLGHGLWQRRFGADPGVIGRVVRMNGLAFTVVGVMPPAFRFPGEAEIWMPMGFTPEDLKSRNNHVVWAVGRLKPDVTPQQAQAEMDLLMPRLHPDNLERTGGVVRGPLRRRRPARARRVVRGRRMSLADCVCERRESAARSRCGARAGDVRADLARRDARANRAAAPDRDRAALVAGRRARSGRCPRRHHTCSHMAVAGDPSARGDITRSSGARVHDGVVDRHGRALRALSGASPVPAGPARCVEGGAAAWPVRAGRTRIRNTLVIAEVALAVVLLVGAGLFLRSLWRLLDVPLGFNPQNVLAVTINLPATIYREPFQQVQFAERLLDRLKNVPGIDAVGVSTAFPLTGVTDVGIRFDGRSAESRLFATNANYFRVTPAYLRVMQIPLIRGRLFTEQDTATSPPVVLINETMARRFFPDEDPIGKRLDITGHTYMREIVGIVGDIKQESLRTPTPPQVYEPFAQQPRPAFHVLLRASGHPLRFAETVRQEVRAIDNAQPISAARLMEEIVARSLTRDRFSVFVLGAFAGLALMLAAVGLYGVVAYLVTQRTNEIGVRIALGAETRGIQRLVVVQSLRMVLIGLEPGARRCRVVSGILGSLLYEVKPQDPMTLAGVTILLFAVALAAAFIPARRASRIDPVLALRAE